MLELPSVSESPRPDSDSTGPDEPPLYGPSDVAEFRSLAASIRIAPAIKEYIVDLVRATRDPAAYGLPLAPLLELGASPRADHRPGPRRPRPRPAGRPRLRDAPRRQESRPRHHAASHPGQLRGRRRGPLARRPPPAHPRPHPRALSRSDRPSITIGRRPGQRYSAGCPPARSVAVGRDPRSQSQAQ